MGSAHCLTERLLKVNENLSKGSGDMKQTQNSRVNPMTLKCDIDFEFVQLSHGFCGLSH